MNPHIELLCLLFSFSAAGAADLLKTEQNLRLNVFGPKQYRTSSKELLHGPVLGLQNKIDLDLATLAILL